MSKSNRNPVTKNMHKFCKPSTEIDKKKLSKKGYKKHKKEEI